MFGCSLVQAPLIHIVSWWDCRGYLGKDIRVPLPSCAVLGIREEFPSQDYGGFHEVQEWMNSWASFLALKQLLRCLTACTLSGLSILDARVGDFRSGLGLSALDLVHHLTISCIRSSMYSEETQFTFSPKHVKYHVNRLNNIAVLINACKCVCFLAAMRPEKVLDVPFDGLSLFHY